jgi:hypothetical protein
VFYGGRETRCRIENEKKRECVIEGSILAPEVK